MKTTVIGWLILGLVLPAFAVERGELDSRIRALGARFEALEAQPARRVPADLLNRAQAVILLERGHAGADAMGGVALAKNPVSGMWSPSAFIAAVPGRLGLQPTAGQSFFVILLMTTDATRLLVDPNYEFAVDSLSNSAVTNSPNAVVLLRQSILVFDDQQGFLGGASVRGGTFLPDDEANRIYYGREVTPREILFLRQVNPTPATIDLGAKINAHASTPVQ